MTDIATLQSLLERVTSGDGADRELDRALATFVLNMGRDPTLPAISPVATALPFTASLEAAVALVERVRPSATLTLRKSAPGHWDERQWGVIMDDKPMGWTVCVTPSRALLAALLQSLISEARNG